MNIRGWSTNETAITPAPAHKKHVTTRLIEKFHETTRNKTQLVLPKCFVKHTNARVQLQAHVTRLDQLPIEEDESRALRKTISLPDLTQRKDPDHDPGHLTNNRKKRRSTSAIQPKIIGMSKPENIALSKSYKIGSLHEKQVWEQGVNGTAAFTVDASTNQRNTDGGTTGVINVVNIDGTNKGAEVKRRGKRYLEDIGYHSTRLPKLVQSRKSRPKLFVVGSTITT